MLYVAEVVCKTAKRGVREWYPSTIGPLLPTMTDSLLAPGREVLYKRYHTGELVPATILGPSNDRDDFVWLNTTEIGATMKTHPPLLVCFEWAGYLVPRDVLLPVHNIVACTEHCVQRTLPVRTVFFWDIIIHWTQAGG